MYKFRVKTRRVVYRTYILKSRDQAEAVRTVLNPSYPASIKNITNSVEEVEDVQRINGGDDE